jgi:hypothetical protein
VQYNIQDDAEINIFFQIYPSMKVKMDPENNQQFSHKDVGASEARFNSKYDRFGSL